jgi:hypothetical protein
MMLRSAVEAPPATIVWIPCNLAGFDPTLAQPADIAPSTRHGCSKTLRRIKPTFHENGLAYVAGFRGGELSSAEDGMHLVLLSHHMTMAIWLSHGQPVDLV